MICRNCLRAAAAQSRISASSTAISTRQRFLSSSTRLANASPTAAQQFSSSTSNPAPPSSTAATQKSDKKPSPLVKSSIPAGQPLKGLNFLKNAQDPVALHDDEYPSWLWTILERQEAGKEGGSGVGDLFSKSKKQRRAAAKALRKEQALHPELLAPKIPLTEQTIDLPVGDGSVEGAVRAAQARDELTKAMRGKRRAGIKERNFLKAMG